MDLASYADLAVRLVNTADDGRGDHLTSPESFRALTADHSHLAGRVSAADLELLRLLRGELRQVFAAAASGEEPEVAARLNALLAMQPIHQQLVRHDGQPWHLHLVDSGSAADKYTAGAIAGLTWVVNESGPARLGICAGADCSRVFVDLTAARGRRHCSDRCGRRASVRPLRVTPRGRRGPSSQSTAAS